MKRIILSITTNSSGAATVTDTGYTFGLLYGARFVPGTLDTGTDLTLTTTASVGASTLLTVTNTGTSAVDWYPRAAACTQAASVQSSYTEMPVVDGVLSLTVAQGGNTKSGALIVYVLELD